MKILFLLFISTLIFMQTNSQNEGVKAEISTSYGNIIIMLYDNTPIHRDNFVKLAEDGFYNDLLFHRVINNFMIQGGDPQSRNAAPGAALGMGGPGYTLTAEILSENYHKKGAIAAARQGDNVNPKKESSGSQFYIVHGRPFSDAELQQMEARSGIKFTEKQKEIYKTIGGTPHLDGEYTVFGEVVSGMEVIDRIAATKTARGDRPIEDIKMRIRILN